MREALMVMARKMHRTCVQSSCRRRRGSGRLGAGAMLENAYFSPVEMCRRTATIIASLKLDSPKSFRGHTYMTRESRDAIICCRHETSGGGAPRPLTEVPGCTHHLPKHINEVRAGAGHLEYIGRQREGVVQ